MTLGTAMERMALSFSEENYYQLIAVSLVVLVFVVGVKIKRRTKREHISDEIPID